MSTKITRENIKSKYEALVEERKELTNKKYEVLSTQNVQLFGNKPINTMSAIEVVLFSKHLKDHIQDIDFMNDFIDENQDFLEGTVNLDFPFDVTAIMLDMRLRLLQLKDERRLEKITQAIKVLKKNLSEDDRFDLDMSNLDV